MATLPTPKDPSALVGLKINIKGYGIGVVESYEKKSSSMWGSTESSPHVVLLADGRCVSWLGAPTLNDGKGEVNGEILTMQCVLITLWTHRESSWRMARAYAAAAATLLSSAQLRICSSDNFEFEASFLRVDFSK